ncbi:hypothetical protein HanLR1_Chr01g0033121 [Helianthus annuus]|nr:hypothetical protein HanLR1_Chr01g0033121 [Helianthus annuus]
MCVLLTSLCIVIITFFVSLTEPTDEYVEQCLMISAASMTNWLLLLVMMMLMVRNTCLSQPSSTVANGTRWDVLEAATNRIHLDDDHGIRENEYYAYYLWNLADLYMKHCGPIDGDGLRHRKSWPNMCLYAEDKAMIEEAIIVTCGSNNVAPYGNYTP